MTDFTEGRTMKCEYCGRTYFEPEGKMCDCWQCSNCGGWFDDLGDCANKEKWLCVYCEGERLQAETTIDKED